MKNRTSNKEASHSQTGPTNKGAGKNGTALFQNNQDSSSASSTLIQRKLTIGSPNDPYEREADDIASKVMRKINAASPKVQKKCKDCEKEERVQRKEAVQSSLPAPSTSSNAIVAPAVLQQQLQQAKGGGKALPSPVMSQMESAFGTDFSKVRIHSNSQAAQMANSIQAKAFTSGNDIFFNQGELDLKSNIGKELLAHELTHVEQQKNTIRSKIVQRSRLRDFKRNNVSDSDLTDTNEYKAYMNSDLVWQKELNLTPEEAMLAVKFMLEAMNQRERINWGRRAREFALKARNTLMQEQKVVIYSTGVACSCDQSTITNYEEKTFKFISSISQLILKFSRERDVPPGPVAGAIADEFNTRRGLKAIVDAGQDLLLNILPETFIGVDRFFDIKLKLLNALENDIGNANIKVRTALELVQFGELEVKDSPISDIQVNKIIDFLLTERGTVIATTSVIRKARNRFDNFFTDHSQPLRESVYVSYFKQGESYVDRFLENLKKNPKHNICPGNGGCRFLVNRQRLFSSLKVNKP